MKETEKKGTAKAYFSKGVQVLFLVLGNTALIAGIWRGVHFDGVTAATMIYQLTVPMDGADPGNFTSLFWALGIGIPVLTALELLLVRPIREWLDRMEVRRAAKGAARKNPEDVREDEPEKQVTPKKFKWRFFRNHPVAAAATWFGLVALFMLMRMQVFSYCIRVMFPSSLYEDYYVAAEDVSLKAPEERRNLIYIYLESMEITYADRTDGGVASENRIPYLTELAYAGENFSDDGKLNGMLPVEGALWTCGSLVSQSCGTPLIVPIGRNNMGKGYTEFLPGAYSIGEILAADGYNQIFMQGSEIRFAGTDTFLTCHGGAEVRDYEYYRKGNRLPSEDYFVWWGFEDALLYAFAREEITKAAQEDKPFAVTIMTIDTHFTDGYRCDLCGDDFAVQYDNVIRCADNQIRDFVQWIQSQDFYENTTVVIVGDHPTMDSHYYKELSGKDKKYQRKAYAVILNSVVEYEFGKARSYSAFDMFPTTLAALGYEIPGNRLGLGVNLYSDEPTLVEEMGLKKLNKELVKHSKYYNRHIVADE